MARLSWGSKAILVFWVSYGALIAFVLYAVLPPASLHLVLILGGAEAVFVVLALVALRRAHGNLADDQRA
jgi:hypothetical protein